eukprot:CAMPEP_0204834396 /NCGR_PEP_ID=MMETSP1346-20131115/19733_1 /ASSEMBLY_ACC=CAM_ASM_000771 /TAXON_ID=215587 /ORGANISM="Aplanochytrium stocchinoi, Strain GSBS06" /LENGTH=237 /DNA_ID=CAMNT_0051967707 /DNA_START=741 /DNA_END=1454 /DNA_ORIENTATION=-
MTTNQNQVAEQPHAYAHSHSSPQLPQNGESTTSLSLGDSGKSTAKCTSNGLNSTQNVILPKKTIRSIKGSSQPSIIEKGPLRIVITDSPSDFTIEQHIRELVKFNVKHVCRACEPTYSTFALTQAGIKVHDFAFPDGDPPSDIIITQWLDTIESVFTSGPDQIGPTERISVHCVAGLGRAPVLVAVALVEYCNMKPLEAVQFIRKHRRGAINKKQVKWLESYVPRRSMSKCSGCIIS